MSKEKKGEGTPAVVSKDGNKKTFKCGKKHTIKMTEKKQEVNNA